MRVGLHEGLFCLQKRGEFFKKCHVASARQQKPHVLLCDRAPLYKLFSAPGDILIIIKLCVREVTMFSLVKKYFLASETQNVSRLKKRFSHG